MKNVFPILFVFIMLQFLACGSTKSVQKSNNKEITSKDDTETKVSSEEAKREKIDFLYLEAVTKEALESPKEAINFYLDVLKIDPKHHASMYGIAKNYVQNKNFASAQPYAAEAVKLDPKNYWYVEILSSIYEKTYQQQKAMELLEKSLPDFPKETNLKFQLADLYLANGQYRKSIDLYDSVEATLGIMEEISMHKHRIYLILNENEKANNEIKNLISNFPYEAKYYHSLSDAFSKQNKPDSSFKVIQDMLKIIPNDDKSLFKMADYYKAKGDLTKSAVYLDKAFQNKQVSLETKVEYISTLVVAMQSDSTLKPKVLELTNVVYKQNPESALVLALKGDILMFNNQIDSSKVYYEKSLKIDELNLPVWIRLLERDSDMNKPEILKKDADKALEVFPNDPTVIYFHGLALYQMKEYTRASKSLQKIEKLGNVNDAFLNQVFSLLGEIYFYNKEYEKSNSYYEKILTNDPNNISAMNNYAYYLSVRGENLEKALQMIEKVIAKEPESASYQDTYGWILFKMNKFDDAKKWVLKAYGKGGGAEVIEHLGDICFKLGEKDNAMKYWNEAKSKGQKSDDLDKKIKEGKL